VWFAWGIDQAADFAGFSEGRTRGRRLGSGGCGPRPRRQGPGAWAPGRGRCWVAGRGPFSRRPATDELSCRTSPPALVVPRAPGHPGPAHFYNPTSRTSDVVARSGIRPCSGTQTDLTLGSPTDEGLLRKPRAGTWQGGHRPDPGCVDLDHPRFFQVSHTRYAPELWLGPGKLSPADPGRPEACARNRPTPGGATFRCPPRPWQRLGLYVHRPDELDESMARGDRPTKALESSPFGPGSRRVPPDPACVVGPGPKRELDGGW